MENKSITTTEDLFVSNIDGGVEGVTITDGEDDTGDKFEVRGYQVDLIEVAKRKNVVLCLPTGSGKTFIALEVIKHMLGKYYGFNKKIIFLANTVPLVSQQEGFLRRNLPGVKVTKLVGDMGVDFFNGDDWRKLLITYEILVMSTSIARTGLDHGYLKWNQVSLLILDECHHATKDHAMVKVMHGYRDAQTSGMSVPRVLGLTATIVKGKAKKDSLTTAIDVIEKNLCSQAVTHPNFEEVLKHSTSARVSLVKLAKPVFTTGDGTLAVVRDAIRLLDTLPEEKNAKEVLLGHLGLRDRSQLYNPPLSMKSKARKFAVSVTEIHQELGPYCGVLAAKAQIPHIMKYIKELENYKQIKAKEDLLFALEALNTAFVQYEHSVASLFKRHYYLQYLPDQSGDEPILTEEQFKVLYFQSEKVQATLNILRDRSSQCDTTEESLCGLIFCQRRLTTKVLCWYLQELSTLGEDYKFIKTNFLVGSSNSNLDLDESRKAAKWQAAVLSEFRQKMLNVIVATSVLEEGLDIPSCNLVIRLDGIDNYPSYIQSMGRARQKSASFHILVPLANYDTVCRTIAGFQQLNARLSQTLADKLLNRYEEMDLIGPAKSNLPDFCPGGKVDSPKIPETEFISVVTRYCQLLGSDGIVPCEVAWCDKLQNQYIGYLILPNASPVRGVIMGDPEQNRKIAKRSVYRRAVELLYEAGELDADTLLPRKKKIEEYQNQFLLELEEEKQKRRSNKKTYEHGTRKSTEEYPKRAVLEHLNEKVQAGVPLYLLRIVLLPGPATGLDFSQHSYCYGFISKYRFEHIPVFTLEGPRGSIKVVLKVISTNFILTEAEICKLMSFQKFLAEYVHLKHIDSLLLEMKSVDENVLLLLALKNEKPGGPESVDWRKMEELFKFQTSDYVMEPISPQQIFRFRPALYEDAVIIPWYRNDFKEGEEMFYVDTWDPLITALASFPADRHKSYLDHFRNLAPPHGPVNIIHPDLPLLCCRKTTKRRKFLKQAKRRSKESSFNQKYPPELVNLTPIPASLLLQGIYLSSAIHRLDGLLLALKCQYEVGNIFDWNVSRNGKDMEFKKTPEMVEETTPNQQLYLDVLPNVSSMKFHGMDFGLEYESPVHYNWKVVYQRVSDQVQFIATHGRNYRSKSNFKLKMVPRALPSRLPLPEADEQTFPSWDRRTDFSIEKGPTLFEIMAAFTTANCNDSYDLEISEIMGDAVLKIVVSCHIFSLCPSWKEGKMTAVRTLHISNNHLYAIGSRNKFGEILAGRNLSETNWIPPGYKCTSEISSCTHEAVSDKSIADCVEALIGAYYTNGGIDAALRVMYWIGLKGPGGPTPDDKAVPYNREDSFSGFSKVGYTPGHKTPENIFPNLKFLENVLGYKYQNPWIAVEAVSHATYLQNDVTPNYQRLEFLGDAVIDFLVTDYIVQKAKIDDPGKVTDIRSALVNNVTFGCIAERFDLVHLLLHSSEKLHNSIRYFSDFQRQHGRKVINPYLLLTSSDAAVNRNVEVPKACGDVFESIIGSVFLDSKFSFDATWKVLYRLMKTEISAFIKDPPINPVRMLMEKAAKLNHKVQINEIESNNDSTNKFVEIRIGDLCVEGVGSTKKHAKEAAAKSMILKLKSSPGASITKRV